MVEGRAFQRGGPGNTKTRSHCASRLNGTPESRVAGAGQPGAWLCRDEVVGDEAAENGKALVTMATSLGALGSHRLVNREGVWPGEKGWSGEAGFKMSQWAVEGEVQRHLGTEFPRPSALRPCPQDSGIGQPGLAESLSDSSAFPCSRAGRPLHRRATSLPRALGEESPCEPAQP